MFARPPVPPSAPGGAPGPGGGGPGRPAFPPGMPLAPGMGAMNSAMMMSMMNLFLSRVPALGNIPGMPGAQKNVQAMGADLSIPPNKTLYVNNLDDKIKIDQLKKELRAMFEVFGKVLDIVAMKSYWRRGQAWVVFEDQEAATKALNGLQGFPYGGKPIRINYAHSKSDVFAKQDGTFVERPKGPKKPRAILARERTLQQQLQQFRQQLQQQALGQTAAAGAGSKEGAGGKPDDNPEAAAAAAQAANTASMIAAATAAAAEAAASTMRKRPADNSGGHVSAKIPRTAAGFFATPFMPAGLGVSLPLVPNSTLFVEGLPDNCSEAPLKTLFGRLTGFKGVRLIAVKRVAFVDFEDEAQAGTAMNALQNFNVEDGYPMRITYAKK